MAEVNVSESRLILHLHWTLTERTQMQTVMVISFSSTITNTDRAVLKIENVSSFSPINMDRKLTTSLYDVLSMHATYAPFIVVYAATDNVCLCVTSDDMDPFPDDRIVPATDNLPSGPSVGNEEDAVENIPLHHERQGDKEGVEKKEEKETADDSKPAAQPRRAQSSGISCVVEICVIPLL